MRHSLSVPLEGQLGLPWCCISKKGQTLEIIPDMRDTPPPSLPAASMASECAPKGTHHEYIPSCFFAKYLKVVLHISLRDISPKALFCRQQLISCTYILHRLYEPFGVVPVWPFERDLVVG